MLHTCWYPDVHPTWVRQIFLARDLTCTQVWQKWHVPAVAGNGNDLSKAFKFEEPVFELAEEGKKRKRPLEGGSRESFCSTPPYALETNVDESLVENLRLAGKAALFWNPMNWCLAIYFKHPVPNI